jgi:hypothetical protein
MYEKKIEEQLLSTPSVDKHPSVASKNSSSGQLGSSMIGIGHGKDYLGIKAQPKYMVLFGTGKAWSSTCIEILLFADKIKKINMFDWTQERIFIITTERIYNIKKQKIKRQIQVRILTRMRGCRFRKLEAFQRQPRRAKRTNSRYMFLQSMITDSSVTSKEKNLLKTS